jgi:signal transduction histidine kinase
MAARSLARRLTLVTAATSLVAVLVAGLAIGALLRDFVREQAEERLDATMVALMASVSYDPVSARLSLDAAVADPRFEEPLSGWYWQIAEGAEVLIRSGSLWTDELALTGEAVSGPDGAPLLALTRQFTAPGGTGDLVIAATMPRAVLDAETGAILGPLALSLGLLVAILTIAIAVQVRVGLAPLKRLRAGLDAIRQGRADAVPDLPYAEIGPVATGINQLIAANRETLERTRTHVGNLAHGLKTPLSVIGGQVDRLDQKAPSTLAIADAAGTMERMIGHHLRRARAAGAPDLAGTRTPVAEVIEDLRLVLSGVHADKQLAIAVATEGQPVFAGERQDLEEMLGNLIDNACKWATRTVEVTASTTAARVLVRVADDGPGMTQDQVARAGERGLRFDQTRPGTGLGLSIVTDIAALYGGTLTIETTPGTGTTARLDLPAAP